jgi:hypothetical protein
MNQFYATNQSGWARDYSVTRDEELVELKEQFKELKEIKDNLEKRLNELSKE